ncbi:hypothetical protein P775_11130 [Puniceibacterium antarcticum]|uniref:Regulatory protein GemA n=1 Tax=Puniceibacterium antarcticum TaxID=1206336 RepID=A0A2G8RFN7_9RHOB|nr:regulatory protein GemA [Puniceibacterium antarcticum]PIL20211.1 hypothetical protein P775_11130 [Puniceibacterium antarcticum]
MNHNAIINIAKAQLGLEEDDYRAMLCRVTGKASLRVMSGGQKDEVIKELKRLGFRVKAGGKRLPASTRPYVRLIWALWSSCKKLDVIQDGSRTALRAFCQGIVAPGDTTITIDPDLLSYAEATPVIEALKAMERRGKARK